MEEKKNEKIEIRKEEHIEHDNNGFCEKNFFNSFQCQKKLFIPKYHKKNQFSKITSYNNIENHKFKSKNDKKSIYFKLFVQSCNKDEEEVENNYMTNEKCHYTFSSDDNFFQNFYYVCQKTED